MCVHKSTCDRYLVLTLLSLKKQTNGLIICFIAVIILIVTPLCFIDTMCVIESNLIYRHTHTEYTVQPSGADMSGP